jgi:opacity protein-like surface antigen
MTGIKFITATAIIALAAAGAVTGVEAADLYVPPPDDDVFVDTADPTIYALLYGGLAFDGPITWDDAANDPWGYHLLPGYAAGAAIGVSVMEGLSVELDLFHTGGRTYDDDPDYITSTTSLMINGKYTLHLNEVFDVYGGAGVGGIFLRYDSDGTIYSGWGAGYQLMVGASANVTENIAIFGELRHQNSFAPIQVEGGYTIQAPVTAALIGIKLSM